MASEKELKWLDIYLESGNDKEATRQIFNCGTERNVTIRSCQLKNKLALDIDKRLRENMRVNSVVMHKILCNLATDAKSEQVLAKAAIDLLDRGGYKPVDQHEELVPEQSMEQMEQEYQQAIQNLPVNDLMGVLYQMPEDERQALIDSMKETSQ